MLRVANVMSRRVVAVSAEATIREGEELMTSHDIHHLVVVNGDDDLRGVVCACDARGRDPNASISQVMSAPIATIPVTATIAEAAERFRSLGLGCLVVVSGGLLLGILTRTDLRRAGVPLEELATHFCASCGGDHDLVLTCDEDVAFCRDCLERSHPAPGDELGQPAD